MKYSPPCVHDHGSIARHTFEVEALQDRGDSPRSDKYDETGGGVS